MVDALAAFRARLGGRLSPAEFDARVAAARVEFDGLLDDEALALLVLDELGLNEGAFVRLADLSGRAEASVRIVIERVEAPREFAREGRPPGRVVGCVVRDESGEARLTLWDRDVDKVEDGTLRPGARVTVVNARVKDGRFGPELHVSPWTALEVEGALDPARRKLLADVADTADDAPRALEGAFLGVTPTRTYRRSDGGAGFQCDLDLETAEGRVRVLLWDELVRAARALPPGARVVVEGARRHAGGWQAGAGARLVPKGS